MAEEKKTIAERIAEGMFGEKRLRHGQPGGAEPLPDAQSLYTDMHPRAMRATPSGWATAPRSNDQPDPPKTPRSR